MQNGGVQIVEMDAVVDGFESEIVGGAVDVAAFDAAAGHPHGETVVVVVAAFAEPLVGAGRGQFDGRCAAEFAAPQDEGFVEQTALFQVGEQGGDGLVPQGGVAFVQHDVVVVIPGDALAGPGLDEAHPALDQAARDEHLPAVNGVAVEVADVGRFGGNIEHVGGFHLHAESQVEGLDARLQRALVADPAHVFGVQAAQQVELASLVGGGDFAVADVVDELFDLGEPGVDVLALEGAGQKGRAPVARPEAAGKTVGTQGNETGQVLVFAAQSVERPGADAGTRLDRIAAGHLQGRGRMIGHAAVHRADQAQIVDVLLGGPGEQFADLDAALAVFLESEGRLVGDAGLALGLVMNRQGFAVVFVEQRFAVEGVDLGGPAVHEQVDDVFGGGRVMGLFRAQRRSGGGGGGTAGCRGSFVVEQRSERQPADAAAGLLQPFAAGGGEPG